MEQPTNRLRQILVVTMALGLTCAVGVLIVRALILAVYGVEILPSVPLRSALSYAAVVLGAMALAWLLHWKFFFWNEGIDRKYRALAVQEVFVTILFVAACMNLIWSFPSAERLVLLLISLIGFASVMSRVSILEIWRSDAPSHGAGTFILGVFVILVASATSRGDSNRREALDG